MRFDLDRTRRWSRSDSNAYEGARDLEHSRCETVSCIQGDRAMARNESDRYDPWYVKAAFGLFLCSLVGLLVALYSGVPVAQFLTTHWLTQ